MNSSPHSRPTSSGDGSQSRTSSPATTRAKTIIEEFREKSTPHVPAPDHTSAKKLGHEEVEKLLVQFIAEKMAHAHLSAQIENPTRQSITTLAKAWTEQAETIIEAVRRVDRDNPPSSFWEMQK